MAPNVAKMLTQVGLTLDLLGALLIGSELLGNDRVRRLDRTVKGWLRSPREKYNELLGAQKLSMLIATALGVVTALTVLIVSVEFMRSRPPWSFLILVAAPFLSLVFLLMSAVVQISTLYTIALLIWLLTRPLYVCVKLQAVVRSETLLPTAGVLLLVVGIVFQLMGTF